MSGTPKNPLEGMNPACRRCESTHTVRNGRKRGEQVWLCRGCGRWFFRYARRPGRGTYSDADRVKALALVRELGTKEAQYRLKVGYCTLRRWARSAGAMCGCGKPLIHQGTCMTDAERQRIVDMAAAGYSGRSIELEVSRAWDTVKAIVSAAGVLCKCGKPALHEGNKYCTVRTTVEIRRNAA